jgi:uncharacterized protein with HEPN domain
MNPAERDLHALLDMLQSAELALNYMSGKSLKELRSNLTLQDAVLYRILLIGEASKRVSPPMREQVPTIPWAAIAGMRNRLIHEYDRVDLDKVWETVTLSLPTLVSELAKVVPPDRDS